MDEVQVDNGDITLRVEVEGEGPVVLCVHGWPELASSGHHQVRHLAERGYRVAAMAVRGYGGSSAPPEIERYTLAELASDVAAVAAALDDGPIVLAGHDWGAPIVWNTAIRHPDRVRAVAGLSVPYTPPMALSILDLFDQLNADRFFYMLYIRQPGMAEAHFGADLRAAQDAIESLASARWGPALTAAATGTTSPNASTRSSSTKARTCTRTGSLRWNGCSTLAVRATCW